MIKKQKIQIIRTDNMIKAFEYKNKELKLIDQTLLPARTVYVSVKTVDELCGAIKKLMVRGAPAIGIAAAYGVCISAHSAPKTGFGAFYAAVKKDADCLSRSRPTAVNLFWALDRMIKKALELKDLCIEDIINGLEKEARLIQSEDIGINRAIGENLLSLLNDGDAVLTHCNAGVLATAGYGTALSPFYLAKERGINIKVYADETRPLLQGARLTAYELSKSGIDVTLICDNMAAAVMSQRKINAVITGCDRVAANGDTANKIGTLGASVLAKHFGIPFYIAAPTPTIDLSCLTGADIPIELRDADEVRRFGAAKTAPDGVKVYNPAFDVTPWQNITAIVTEKGILRPPFKFNAECEMRNV